MAGNPNHNPSSGAAPQMTWRESVEIYMNWPVIVMLVLGFSAGLPILLIFSTLSFWLRELEVSRTEIGFLSWVLFMYSIKVVWAPFVDRISLPVLTPLLGKRRSWMLVAQAGIICGLIAISSTSPAEQIGLVAVLALTTAFFSATQDIVIDAYRIEAAEKELQAAMAATYQLGYRIALIVAGAGALYTAEYFSWPAAYVAMALCMGVGVAMALIIKEPDHTMSKETAEREKALEAALFGSGEGRLKRLAAWFSGAVVSPIADFFQRAGFMPALLILLLIGLYRVSDITMGIMANPFYVDMEYTKTEIANIIKIYGVIMTIVGALAGGILVARYGIMRPLLFGAILAAAANLVFAYLALVVPGMESNTNKLWHLTLTICADNFSGGLSGAALIAYMSSLTNSAYTATQYALFSSLYLLPGKFIGGFSGLYVDTFGYVSFFTGAAILGIPAILLTIVLMRRAIEEE